MDCVFFSKILGANNANVKRDCSHIINSSARDELLRPRIQIEASTFGSMESC